jgi:hypothetical protein
LAFELAAVVHADNMGVPQAARQFGLAVEALLVVGIRRHIGAQDFQRLEAGQPGMAYRVDLAHATDSEQPAHGVARELRPLA